MKCFVPTDPYYRCDDHAYIIEADNRKEASMKFTRYVVPAPDDFVHVVELPHKLLTTLRNDNYAMTTRPTSLQVYVVTGYGPWLIEMCLSMLKGHYSQKNSYILSGDMLVSAFRN